MADKKRKASESKTPAKKRKVEPPKKTPVSAKKSKTATPKKVTSTKAKKPVTKKTPAKSVKTPDAKKTPKSTKTPAKSSKTPQKNKSTPAKKEAPRPAQKKDVKKLAVKTVTRAKLETGKATSKKAQLDKAKALRAKAAASKAKLKASKSAIKQKPVVKSVQPKPVAKAATGKKSTPASKPEPKAVKKAEKQDEDKKPEEKKDVSKKAEKKETPKAKAAKKAASTDSVAKRKNTDTEEDSEAPRKRRMITPNKKFADFELDVPSKRTITPNKKYADYETDASSKRVSELRAFIQDKKKSPTTTEAPKSEKPKKSKTSTPSVSKSDKESETKETPAREIKVFKPSEMKPAEKLMKKLQKKLEKEAKSAATPKPVENRDKAKIKITKVVTYDKPMSSDEKEMRALKATPKAKTTPSVKAVATESAVKTPKQQAAKTTVTKAVKAAPKPTPKAKAPEKQPPKPKKIKELRKEERPIQAKFLCEKNIKFKDDNDKLSCWITGISVFPSGEIIMVDMTNRKIKLFSKDFDFLSQVKLDTIPQDISVSPVNVSDAYFTKPFSKEGIQKVTMSDGKLTLKESFWTNGTNRGITCTKAGILTSVQDGRYHDLDINHFKIDLLDYEGKVLQTVSTDSNGSRLFKLPLYFTVDSTGKQMIVADCIKNFSYVVSLDMTGKVKFKYEGVNNNLVTPRGLTIDDEDNIYVTEWERHNVYILSPTGKRLQVLFNDQELKDEGLSGLQKPYQLCFYYDGNIKKLIVSQEGCNTVKVFQMLKKGPETEALREAAAAAMAEKKSLPNGDASPQKPAILQKTAGPTKTQAKAAPAVVKKSVASGTTIKEAEIASGTRATPGESTPKTVTVVYVKPDKSTVEMKQTTTAISQTEEAVQAMVPEAPTQETLTTTTVHADVPESKEQSPPTLNAEFGDDFDTAENEMEENPSVQDAINSLNDSKDQSESEPVAAETSVDPNQAKVETYEHVSIPQVETGAVGTQEEITETVSTQPEEMQVQEDMQVQQVELVNTQYGQVLVPQMEEIITTQPVDTEIQSVPMEAVSQETIIIQHDQMNPEQYEKIETVTVNNNDANNMMQTETVQYVTNVSIGENYATNIAQGEIVTEVPEEIVTMVTETV